MNTKTKILALMAFLILIVGLLGAFLRIISSWFDTYTFQFNKVVQIQLQKPIEVKKRELKLEEVIKVINEAPLPSDLTPIQQYICEKFGPYDC